MLEQCVVALGGRSTRLKPAVVGSYGECDFRIEYRAGGSVEHAGRPEDRRFSIAAKRRWRNRRIAIRRSGHGFTRERQFQRLENKLEILDAGQRSAVVEALTAFAGPFLLTRSGMWTALPYGSSAREVIDRVRTMVSYLDRLAAGAAPLTA